MSWLSTLYETYDNCAGRADLPDSGDLLPVAHTTVQSHIEIALSVEGNFLSARALSKDESTTVIPCTEDSANRTSGPVPHPLSDKLQYVAGDFADYGGKLPKGVNNPEEIYQRYIEQLREWEKGSEAPLLKTVLAYVQKGTVVRDLVNYGTLPTDSTGKLPQSLIPEITARYPIFQILPKGNLPESCVVRWAVQIPGRELISLHQDPTTYDSWSRFYTNQLNDRSICAVTGKLTTTANLHPSKIRNAGDRAKLVSSNDGAGFTYRGRFLAASEACTVSFEVSQKAHSALRWLVGRQGYQNDTQVVVAWSISGKPVPSPLDGTNDYFGDDELINGNCLEMEPIPISEQWRDIGQSFAAHLSRKLRGYRAKLLSSETISIMCIDSASPGRLAIPFYRECTADAYLKKIEDWHSSFSWVFPNSAKQRKQAFQSFLERVYAPSPRTIAVAAYGRRLDEKLSRSSIERILPCIVDGRQFPRDMLLSIVERASQRTSFKEWWEWENSLCTACAVFRGFYTRVADKTSWRNYLMSLETDRRSRDYLFGRLLAYAEHIEDRALYVGGENRETMAAKLMQRFSNRPSSTWRNIENALAPYKARLRSRRPGFLARMNDEMDSVFGLFEHSDFIRDEKLSGEYLLGYHCQREALKIKQEPIDSSEEKNNEIIVAKEGE